MSIYTYSCLINEDTARCCNSYDTIEEAYEDAIESAKRTEETGRMFFGDEATSYFVRSHRVLFIGENGERGVLGAKIPKTDEPTMYYLYVGMIGDNLILAGESEDCEELVDKYHELIRKTDLIMSFFDEEAFEKCKEKTLGIIVNSNDRNFMKSIK